MVSPVERTESSKAILTEVFSYFDYWGKQVEPKLREFFQAEQGNLFCGEDYGKEVLEKITELTLRGGKRQRVAFVVATTSLLGKDTNNEQVKKSIIDAAIGVEILQTHLLIHDDIIDEAPLRRGGQTIHRFFTEQFPQRAYRGDAKKYGDSVGLLAGDLAVYFACQPIINSEAISPEKKIKILDVLIRSGIDTFYGQLLDLFRDAKGTTSEEEILKLAFIKAGRSSAEAPMHIGAILADRDNPDVLEKLSAYALPASIAAQLQDDILGMFGNEKTIGKSSLSDLAEGKQTLLILEARKRANREKTEILNRLVGKKDITDTEAEKVKEIIIETGALLYTKEIARKFANQAQKALETWDVNWEDQARHFFWAVSEDEIKRAVQKIVRLGYKEAEITEELISQSLDTSGQPDPDLVIRTGGRYRLSGFLPWQGVYAEIYFSDILWPDFGIEEFNKAISWHQEQTRTFGH